MSRASLGTEVRYSTTAWSLHFEFSALTSLRHVVLHPVIGQCIDYEATKVTTDVGNGLSDRHSPSWLYRSPRTSFYFSVWRESTWRSVEYIVPNKWRWELSSQSFDLVFSPLYRLIGTCKLVHLRSSILWVVQDEEPQVHVPRSLLLCDDLSELWSV